MLFILWTIQLLIFIKQLLRLLLPLIVKTESVQNFLWLLDIPLNEGLSGSDCLLIHTWQPLIIYKGSVTAVKNLSLYIVQLGVLAWEKDRLVIFSCSLNAILFLCCFRSTLRLPTITHLMNRVFDLFITIQIFGKVWLLRILLLRRLRGLSNSLELCRRLTFLNRWSSQPIFSWLHSERGFVVYCMILLQLIGILFRVKVCLGAIRLTDSSWEISCQFL